jgi:hypothetical protein
MTDNQTAEVQQISAVFQQESPENGQAEKSRTFNDKAAAKKPERAVQYFGAIRTGLGTL